MFLKIKETQETQETQETNQNSVKDQRLGQLSTATPSATLKCDVIVIGAGLGGLGACILQAQAGLQVVCIEPKRFPHAYVGESLDWSAPALLQKLGLWRDQLVEEEVATYKRKVKLQPLGEEAFMSYPSTWYRNKPLQIEVLTCHVDRQQLDQRLFYIAQELGVTFIWQRVSRVETQENRVVACQTASGQRIEASWFIDASGRARLFAKAFQIPKKEYGRQKVCIWSHFECEEQSDGTTLYGDNADEYLRWIWEIPITPRRVSIGYITPAEQVKKERQSGKSVAQIFEQALIKHPRFTSLLAEQPDYHVEVCSYRPDVHQYACGDNWFMIGEAACLLEPLTANGVTSALRHAESATLLIQESLPTALLGRRQQYIYNTRMQQMGHAFNSHIETTLYDWPLRWGLGAGAATAVYTVFGYVFNALYTKINPRTFRTLALFGILFMAIRLWMKSWLLIGKTIFYTRHGLKSVTGAVHRFYQNTIF